MAEIFDTILKKNTHSLPVLKGEDLVGIVSNYDFTFLLAKYKNFDKLEARDIFNSRILRLSPDDKVEPSAEPPLIKRFKPCRS